MGRIKRMARRQLRAVFFQGQRLFLLCSSEPLSVKTLRPRESLSCGRNDMSEFFQIRHALQFAYRAQQFVVTVLLFALDGDDKGQDVVGQTVVVLHL